MRRGCFMLWETHAFTKGVPFCEDGKYKQYETKQMRSARRSDEQTPSDGFYRLALMRRTV